MPILLLLLSKSCSRLSLKAHRNWLLTCPEVWFISSAGLKALLVALKEAKREKGDLLLAGVQAEVREVLTLTGFSTIFKVYACDPDLKEKAKELGRSVVESGETLGRRFQDDDVKAKFGDVGKAAQEFGKSLVDYFKPEKEIGHTDKEDQQI